MSDRALMLAAAQAVLVRAQGLDLPVAHPLQFGLFDLHRDGGHNGFGGFLLERGQLVPTALVALAPDLALRGVVDEANGDAQPVAAAPDAALDRVAGAKLPQPGLG